MARHIAIVEDEATIRHNYEDALRRFGYQVSGYADKDSALAALKRRLPDLVIIDVGLGQDVEGGFDLCRELRSLSKSLPIIFLTARDSDLDVISGLRLGADDYLTKDISLQHLVARVVALFRRVEALSGGARDEIAHSRSTDGGLTWSAPIRVNPALGTQAFTPSVAVRADGTIGVTYYDLRNNTTAPTILADYWLVQSADGVTWTETHVAGPIDYATAPDARGLFLGDYMGLTSIGTTFVPVYGLTNPGNLDDRTDIFATLASRVSAAKSMGAGVPAAAGPPTDALALTPELERTFADSVRRTVERRRAPRLDRAPDPAR
mgnify:CR=1 FL=1